MVKMEKVLDKLVLILLTIALSVMVVATFAQVLFRFVFGSPLYWSEELGRYCFVYIVFIGGAWAGKTMSHLGVDFFVQKLPKLFGAIIDVIIDVLILVFSTVVVYVSFPVIGVNMKQISPALQIPMGFVYLAIPIGFLLMFGYYFIHLITHIKYIKNKSYNDMKREG